jgi:hypothetical protein
LVRALANATVGTMFRFKDRAQSTKVAATRAIARAAVKTMA